MVNDAGEIDAVGLQINDIVSNDGTSASRHRLTKKFIVLLPPNMQDND